MSTAADSSLMSIIAENLNGAGNDIVLTELHRKYWADGQGHEYINRLAFPADLESLKVSADGNYFATCCFAAVCLPLDLRALLTTTGHELCRNGNERDFRTADFADPF